MIVSKRITSSPPHGIIVEFISLSCWTVLRANVGHGRLAGSGRDMDMMKRCGVENNNGEKMEVWTFGLFGDGGFGGRRSGAPRRLRWRAVTRTSLPDTSGHKKSASRAQSDEELEHIGGTQARGDVFCAYDRDVLVSFLCGPFARLPCVSG